MAKRPIDIAIRAIKCRFSRNSIASVQNDGGNETFYQLSTHLVAGWRALVSEMAESVQCSSFSSCYYFKFWAAFNAVRVCRWFHVVASILLVCSNWICSSKTPLRVCSINFFGFSVIGFVIDCNHSSLVLLMCSYSTKYTLYTNYYFVNWIESYLARSGIAIIS